MTKKYLSAEEFRAAAENGGKPTGVVLRLSVGDPIAATDEALRTIRFVFSDGSVDRAGDTINPNGWELEDFLKNPVALWAHASQDPPIGRAINVGPTGGKLMGDIEFMPADVSPFADSIYRM